MYIGTAISWARKFGVGTGIEDPQSGTRGRRLGEGRTLTGVDEMFFRCQVSVRQPPSFRAAVSSASLEASLFSVCLGGSFFPRFAGLLHPRLRDVAQSLECKGVLLASGLVVCDLHGVASGLAGVGECRRR